MTRERLLRELESLTHDERMRRMFEVGRLSREDGTIEPILRELEDGGFYERRLALQSCYGSGDGVRVLRFIGDESQFLRSLSLRLAVLCCDDAQLQNVLNGLNRKRQRTLLSHLWKRRRFAPIDAFVSTLIEQDSAELERVLAFASARFVEENLAVVMERGGANDWSRLASFHPLQVARWLIAAARSSTRFESRLVHQVRATLWELSDKTPESALELVRVMSLQVPLSQWHLLRLAQRRPAAVADLVLENAEPVNVFLGSILQRVDDEQFQALIDRKPQEVSKNAKSWFRYLNPNRRLAIYKLCERSWRNADGAIDGPLVALLPRAQRELEARRHLELPALATRPAQRLPYASFLEFEEANRVLEPFVRHPDPDVRVVALPSLIVAARYNRNCLPDVLRVVTQRKNEQDPIRGVMLRALSELPPSIWREEHLEELGQIVREMLNAADLSQTTASYAEKLILLILPHHPQWAASWLATLVKERGQVSFWNLQDRLSDDNVRQIAPHLLPVVRSWETREREAQIIALARSLGRRLKVWDDLVALLERVLERSLTSYNASAALSILAQHRRERLATLIPDLLKSDPSWITQPIVYTWVHRRRQDLITAFLGRQTFKGRFSTGRTRWVLPVQSGFERWLPVQQELFEQTLREVTQDEARDSPALFQIINQLAALPDVPPTRLISLADVRNPKPVTRDWALRALARRDNGDGVPTLLQSLEDERARIAIYALRRVFAEMPPLRVLDLLRQVPLQKVTVAKETVRLLGELKTEEAYQTLLEWNERDLHRDVRVALLRGFWDHLERDESWPVLESAAVAEDAAIANGVIRIPTDRLSDRAARRLTQLMATLLRHRDAKVRLDALGRCATQPLSDREQVLLEPLLDALDSRLPDECRAAISAIFASYVGREADKVGTAARRITPNRRALQTLVTTLQSQIQYSKSHLLPTARAVLGALSEDILVSCLRVRLAITALPDEELIPFLTQLAARDELRPDVLNAALSSVDSNADDAVRIAEEWDYLETELARSSDERLRRLALQCLIHGAFFPGWTDDRIERLRVFRDDISPLVAEAAQFTFVPGE